MRYLVLIWLALSLIHNTRGHARTFTRCQLSRELLRYNFPRTLIPNWVCLIEHASGRTTEKVTNHNNSYTSFGLFQSQSLFQFATTLYSGNKIGCENEIVVYSKKKNM